MSNQLKLWLIFLLISLLALILGYQWGSREGLMIAFVLATLVHLVIYLFGDASPLRLFASHRLKGQDPWGALSFVKDLSESAKMVEPVVYLIESPTPISFSSRRSWQSSYVALSSGLVERLSREELRAVIAYHIAQLKMLNRLGFYFSSTLAHSLVGLAGALDMIWPVNWFKSGRGLRWNPATWLFSPMAWLILRLALRPHQFERCDQMAAEWLQDEVILARVIWKLDSLVRSQPLNIPSSMKYQFILDPDPARSEPFLEMTHPSTENRIRLLVGHYPI